MMINSPMIKERKTYIDYFRVFACMLVLCVHVKDLVLTWSDNTILLSNLITNISNLGVPCFFALTGMTILHKKYNSLKEYYLKRFIVVVTPFLFYSYAYYCAYNINEYKGILEFILIAIKSIPNGLLAIIQGEQAYHLWFVYSIIGIYIILPFIKAMLNNSDIKYQKLLFILLIGYIILKTIPGLLGISIKIDEFIFGSNIKYVLFGYFITCDWFKEYLKPSIIIGAISLILNLIIKCNFENISSYFEILNDFELIGLIGLFIINDNKVACWKSKNIINIISKETYGIYLVHPIVIQYTSKYYIYTNHVINTNLKILFYLFIGLVITFFCSFILSWIINKLLIKPCTNLILKIRNQN